MPNLTKPWNFVPNNHQTYETLAKSQHLSCPTSPNLGISYPMITTPMKKTHEKPASFMHNITKPRDCVPNNHQTYAKPMKKQHSELGFRTLLVPCALVVGLWSACGPLVVCLWSARGMLAVPLVVCFWFRSWYACGSARGMLVVLLVVPLVVPLVVSWCYACGVPRIPCGVSRVPQSVVLRNHQRHPIWRSIMRS